MPKRSDAPHRWGPLTMIAPVVRGVGASRWFARHEVLQRFVWVYRFDGEHDAAEALARDVHAFDSARAKVLRVERGFYTPVNAIVPAIVSEFVPSLALDEAIACQLWPDPRAALASLAQVLPLASRGLAIESLGIDASGALCVAHPDCALQSPPTAPTATVALLTDLACSMTSGHSIDHGVQSLLTALASCRDVPSVRALFRSAGLDAPRPLALAAHPSPRVSAVAHAHRALCDPLWRSSREATELTPRLLNALSSTPLDPNDLVLLALLDSARRALAERSMRDRDIDKVVLALVGPLEPTWIPLKPVATARTAMIAGSPCTLCPIVWSDLQPTASSDERERRYCYGCALPVEAIEHDGEPHVLASARCPFVKRPP